MSTTMLHAGIAAVLAAVREYGYDTNAYHALGDIYATRQGDLLLFNYTARAAYARRWNDVERVCRGLIVHVPTVTVRAVPFEKFFNLGETPDTTLEALPAGPCEITAKMDGSMAILYRADDGPAIATRGSFTSSQAQWATAHLRGRYDLRDLPDGVTLLFEIIYPENRIVVNYGALEALVLIGARRVDGYDYTYPELAEFAARYGFPLVAREPAHSIHDVVPLIETSTGVEGWVVRFSNNLRVKVKTADYFRLHRARFMLSPETVRDALVAGTWDSFMIGLPEEFHRESSAIAAAIRALVAAEEARLRALFAEVRAAVAEDSRKAFALYVQAHYRADAAYLFPLWEGRDIGPLLLRKIDLSGRVAHPPAE